MRSLGAPDGVHVMVGVCAVADAVDAAVYTMLPEPGITWPSSMAVTLMN